MSTDVSSDAGVTFSWWKYNANALISELKFDIVMAAAGQNLAWGFCIYW